MPGTVRPRAAGRSDRSLRISRAATSHRVAADLGRVARTQRERNAQARARGCVPGLVVVDAESVCLQVLAPYFEHNSRRSGSCGHRSVYRRPPVPALESPRPARDLRASGRRFMGSLLRSDPGLRVEPAGRGRAPIGGPPVKLPASVWPGCRPAGPGSNSRRQSTATSGLRFNRDLRPSVSGADRIPGVPCPHRARPPPCAMAASPDSRARARAVRSRGPTACR